MTDVGGGAVVDLEGEGEDASGTTTIVRPGIGGTETTVTKGLAVAVGSGVEHPKDKKSKEPARMIENMVVFLIENSLFRSCAFPCL